MPRLPTSRLIAVVALRQSADALDNRRTLRLLLWCDCAYRLVPRLVADISRFLHVADHIVHAKHVIQRKTKAKMLPSGKAALLLGRGIICQFVIFQCLGLE